MLKQKACTKMNTVGTKPMFSTHRWRIGGSQWRCIPTESISVNLIKTLGFEITSCLFDARLNPFGPGCADRLFKRANVRPWQGSSKKTNIWRSQMGQKILISLEGKSMTPRRGNTILLCSSQQLPCLCLRPFYVFLSWHDALQAPSTCLVHCFWNYRNTRTS